MGTLKWVLSTDMHGQFKIKEQRVIMDDRQAAVLSSRGTTAKIVPSFNVFDTRQEAKLAVARKGKMVWVFDPAGEEMRVRHNRINRPEVYKAYVYANSTMRYTIQKLTSAGVPVGEPFERWVIQTFPRANRAYKAMARWVADHQEEYERNEQVVRAERRVLNAIKAELNREKVKIPPPTVSKYLSRRKKVKRAIT